MWFWEISEDVVEFVMVCEEWLGGGLLWERGESFIYDGDFWECGVERVWVRVWVLGCWWVDEEICVCVVYVEWVVEWDWFVYLEVFVF